VTALRETDLVVGRGEYVALVGPSGSGKSTLLNLLGLLDRPTTGGYRLDGVDVASLVDRDRTSVRGARIGFVFQAFHLLPHRTALENVMLAQLYNGAPRSGRREAATSALTEVGLHHRLDALPTTLSGGERQRVAVARALVNSPAILLCDEPTGNLDSATSGVLLDLFDALNAAGLTLIVVTHGPDVAARARRLVSMADGIIHEDRESV
jgi:putative ABC transport system ATP-binding protein